MPDLTYKANIKIKNSPSQPSTHANSNWEKSQYENFTFDLIVVAQNRQEVIVVFNVSDMNFFNSKGSSLFRVPKFKKFVLTALWKELKSCGLASGQAKIKMGLNYTDDDEKCLKALRAYSERETYLFWDDFEIAQNTSPLAA